jgi:hypothetical protein
MISQRFNLLFQKFALLAVLAFSCGCAWASSGICDNLNSATEIGNAGTGSTGMGDSGVVSKGTGIGGTGINPDTVTDPIQLAGNVIYTKGSVEAISNGRSRLLAQGDPVCVGETVVTSQTSTLQIKMTDEGLVTVRPGTQLKIEKYVYAGTAGDTSVFALLKGASRFVTGKIGKKYPQNDLVRTQTATIGVRGTDHEATVILPDDNRGYSSGTYDKVNSGVTFIRTERGEIDIHPNQVGLAANIREMPTLLVDIPDFFTSDLSMREEGATEDIREGISPEHHGKDFDFDHSSEIGTSTSEHSDKWIEIDHPEIHSRPELLESIDIPEMPDSPEIPETPDSPEIPQLPELPED